MPDEDVTRAFDPGRDTTPVPGNAEGPPDSRQRVVGNYRLIEKLGEGGMGQVWLAEQTAPVRRIVAFKLIKVGIYDDEVLRRFESERQSVAMMDHPSIAKVFDAGTTPDGQPYFVMEYVRGVPLTDYCNEKKLRIRDRLQLFVQVCEAVQHAHRKTIIHRDLKPGNILVTEVDGKPVPRIIDFGLAKATSTSFAADVMATRAGVFLGTPGYMSPEQATNTQDVDTRTDVYSLGVVLYELLTGALPIDVSALAQKPILDVLRHLTETDAPRPSTKVRTDRQSSQHAERCGLAQTSQLHAALSGDLDWITLKAMDRDRGRRYDSPADLAADVLRYLHHEPITAHPASTAYRVGKYLRRHRVAASIASGLVLLLAAFAAAQIVQLRRITRERDRANRITAFMTQMFKVSDPGESRGNTITVREVLDKASQDLRTGLSSDPEVQAALLLTMAEVYDNLALPKLAEPLARQSVEIRRRILGPGRMETLTSEYELGYVLKLQLRDEEAERLLHEVVTGYRNLEGANSRDEANALSVLSLVVQERGRYAEAEQYSRQAVAIYRKIGPDAPGTLTAMSNLSLLLQQDGKFADAESLEREVLEVQRRKLGSDSPDTLSTLYNLVITLRDEERYDEGEKLGREAVDRRRRVLGADHYDTLNSMTELGVIVLEEGRTADAERMFREVLAIQERTGQTAAAAYTKYYLAQVLSRLKRLPEAEQMLDETLREYRKAYGPDSPRILDVQVVQGQVFRDEGRYDESERVLREATDGLARFRGAGDQWALFAKQNLFDTLTRQPARRAEADKLAQDLMAHSAAIDPTDQYTMACVTAVSGRTDDALRWLTNAVHKGLPQAVALAIDQDNELASLHGDPRFVALVAEAKARASRASK